MRVVLDTNIILSGLMVSGSLPAAVLQFWADRKFDLLTCEEQISEIRSVTRRPRIQTRIRPNAVGKFVNEMRNTAELHTRLPQVDVSPDPWDNYLLALARAGHADFLVTGDKADLLALGQFEATRIVSTRGFLKQLGIAVPGAGTRSPR